MRIALIVALLAAACVVLPPSTTEAQPAPPLRVAFLGDSLTLGLHATSEQAMYREILIQRLLTSGVSGIAISVFQDPYGLTDDALTRIPGVLAAEPNLVFVEIGNHEAFAGGEAVELFEQRYDELLYQLQVSGATVIAGTLAWLNYAPDSREFADALRLNDTIRRLAEQRGITVADLWTPMLFHYEFISQPGDPSAVDPYNGDDLHPNDAGHKAIADAFWAAYQRSLRPPAVGSGLRAVGNGG